ncbi:hypothetical protein JXB41_07580 [Candidatus Woesearchaeota archaeon]|nr:hypothetical protein [Candidatus Woesearchaeota archaeon]
MQKEKSFPERILDSFNVLGKIIETIIHHADSEIRLIKKKVFYFLILIGFFVISILFVLIGTAKLLPDYLNISEGLSFLVIGAVILVILSFVSFIKQV